MQPLAFLLFLTLPYGGAHAQGSTACSLTSASYGTLAFNCAGTQLTQQFPSVVTATPPQPPQSGVYYIAPNGDDKKDGTTPATAWYTLNHPIARGKYRDDAAGALCRRSLPKHQMGDAQRFERLCRSDVQ
jgi:hypothetical protein